MARAFFLIITFFVCFTTWAAGIYVRNNGHYSELVIPHMATSIVSVTEGKSKIMLELVTPLEANSSGKFDDPFFKSVSVDGHMLTVNFFPGADYTLTKKDGNILITAAKKKMTDGIQLGYGIEKPILKGTDRILENKKAESMLADIDRTMEAKDYKKALTLTEKYLNTGVKGYYRQEGLFRLGNIYYNLGPQSEDNYVYAGKIFDDFLRDYPDSFRKKEALIKSAESKDMAMLYNEAIYAYNNLIKSVSDREVKKMAYEKIANIYAKSGQYNKAMDAHENVIRHFKETFTPQKAAIGLLQAKQKDYDLAYKTFLTVQEHKDQLGLLTPEELYTMAEVFARKDQPDVAKNDYEKVYALYPSSKYADLAMYRSAGMLEKLNKPAAADARLDICRQVYKDKKGGLLCSVMYARRHMPEKTPEDWKNFLKKALNSKDIDIRAEADIVLIRAYFADNMYDEAEKMADDFIRQNFASEHLGEVYDIRQQITLTKARDAYNKSNYPLAKQLVENMLTVFPDSKYKRQAMEILQDISFGDIKDKFHAGKYKETVDELTQFLLKNKDLITPDKWMNMLQEAKFAYAKQLYSQNNLSDAIVAIGEYRASFPKGPHIKEADRILTDSISRKMDEYYKNQEFIKIISLYEQNSGFIEGGTYPDFTDKVKSYTAFALYKMGMPKKASAMLDSVKTKNNPYYMMTAIMLGRIKDQIDPNIFNNGMMSFLVQELETKNPDYIVKMLENYTKDKKFAAKEIYSISKGVFDDLKREAILFDLYGKLKKDESYRFKGYEEVYLDTGIAYYKRNNFNEAVQTLEQFKLLHRPRDEKRAEGLYYLGKSYAKLGKTDEAVNSYMELLESIPNSVYASAARSEVEEIKWRKNLTK